MIPYGRQWISPEDVASVVDVLISDHLTQGPAIPHFEQALRSACVAPHAVAVNSATSGLHIACLALGLETGKRLWTSPNSFVASANVARLCGAEVDFVDIDPDTLTMCPDRLCDKLHIARRKGHLPHIVMPVHFGGQSCDMPAIHTLAAEFGVHVIEDASHAIGARHDGAPVGDCRYSDACVFSFHPVKIVTTGEGGVVTTRDDRLAAKLDRLRSHGITRNPALMTHDADEPWYYQQLDLGLNYRMTDMQAALGTSQMTRLEPFIALRHGLARRYDWALADLPLRRQQRPVADRSALHLYPVQLDRSLPDRARLRRRLFDHLRSDGIGVNVHYIPIHTQPYYRALGFTPGQFPVAEAYYEGALSLPLHPQMSDADQSTVIESLGSGLTSLGLI
ncbi:putative DegT/DnrJ/EryC1/StrS aminotransferase [Roseobacter sp. AzwK-3b]|uniref:UDP-4-amino-4, 6-dideoxy-N-acetyl-beta-L-altrosamine transaminase n=1 Tax=Roseobacter sp. AzwK-3b TaxID=351016 RepID=UPI0001569084|nr:UDP-4-amino-4,6-dideoxy-N-acetyl-beta-L-altrosamine transaminase [Roseobacter sp. AzwK-3b]EDM73237.1 putative DegT/DnrJ/EryC1/StrS aminotransferase [Roseobacter sp. AzwK-3b]